MLIKLLIFSGIFLNICLQKVSSELYTYKEQQSLADSYLKIYIKRFQLIEDKQSREFEQLMGHLNDSKETDRAYNENVKYKYELNLLKATFEMSLTNHTNAEKFNFLNHFPKLIPPYFNNFLMDELDSQFMDQKIRLDVKYLDLMKPDLKPLSLEDEVCYIVMKLKEFLVKPNLRQKLQGYNNITQGLTPEFRYILDRQPWHKIVLKAHLNFLKEYVSSFEEAEIEEFRPEYNVLLRQLEMAQDSAEAENKLKFLEMFNDVTTKFGRFLKVKFEEYKVKFYEE